MKDWIPFLDWILRLIFGSKQERDLKRLNPIVELVNLFEPAIHDQSDQWLTERTSHFQQLLSGEFDSEEYRQTYRSMLEDAYHRVQDVNPQQCADALRDRLNGNREELSEKYEGDAFQIAIESPLAPKNVDGLAEAYRERVEEWKQMSVDQVLEDFDRLWPHFCKQLPDESLQKHLWMCLPEAFSVVREAAHRRLGLRHYDVQILGGIVLHEGRIGEMKTGEGKTLVATLPLYLNALTDKGCHLVTVNDYLARRDARWMGEVYEKLGMEVGLVQDGMKPDQRREEYGAHITYGTNNEFGFDHLRDNMAVREEDTVQPEHHYAILDEVDSVLIDEARTPLIISGPAEKPASLYKKIDKVVARLNAGEDYEVDEKKQTVSLLNSGTDKVEEQMKIDNLFDTANMDMVHHINQAIRAQELYEKDAEYVVQNGEVIIVDEFTGRLQPGRRFSDGLHQAIEAKEGVQIEQENQTLATITIQNFFRMYDKLAGMTGTADTEAEEFHEIYNLDVVVVPTNEPDIRVDHEDAIYRTEDEKFDAVVEKIKYLHENDLPVLVGTVDIDKSEHLGEILKREGIPHNILNAKNHEREAAIVAQAGQPGAVTIATNMAGRGTDIVLGDGVIADECPIQPEAEDEMPYCPHDPVCGLHVLGTERHESRRIDNQLRGRTARQGDPGASRFYVSLEDDLMRLFGSDRMGSMLEKLGLEDGQRIEHSWISKSIKRAQNKVETHHFEMRKKLLEYDDVMEKQRRIIYSDRRKALKQDDVSDTIMDFFHEQVDEWLEFYGEDRRPAEDWPLQDLLDAVEALTGWAPDKSRKEEWLKMRKPEIEEELREKMKELYRRKEAELTEEIMRQVERQLLLQVIDTHWKEHLTALNNLRQGIHLEGMAQRDPLVQYKMESFKMFEELRQTIREDLINFLLNVEAVSEMEESNVMEGAQMQHDETGGLDSIVQDDTASAQQQAVQSGSAGGDSTQTTVVNEEDVGRNDPCPCGSGEKYKYCCG